MSSRILSTASKPLRLSVALQTRASSSQVLVQPTTGRVHVQSGPGGRHSNTGHVATVFGATSFLGRYLVSKLAKAGTQVVVPYREQDEARHLRVCGDLGQIVPMEFDLMNDTQIEECLRHSDTVYNLVGRNYKTKNFNFDDVNVAGARRIARIAHLSGVSRLIHVSHLNADPDSASEFYRTKFEGEHAVREAFPGATVVRPGWMYGHEDRLLNTMSVSPSVYRVNHGETVISPVHVLDVAQAMSLMLKANSSIGQTYALAGPRDYSFEQIMEICEALTLQKLKGPNFPKPALALAARIWDLIWWPTVSPDEVTRRYIDSPKSLAEGFKGFADLGIEPDVLEQVAITYLRRYRSASYFDVPVEGYAVKLKTPRYHSVN